MTAIQRKRTELQAERQSLDARLEAIQAQLALLAELEAEPAPTPATVPPAGKPTPRPADVPAGGKRTTARADNARWHLVRLLTEHPAGLSLTVLAAKTGATSSGVHYKLNHPWFRKSDPEDKFSPWVLSDEGKKAASQLDAK